MARITVLSSSYVLYLSLLYLNGVHDLLLQVHGLLQGRLSGELRAGGFLCVRCFASVSQWKRNPA